MSLNSQQRFKLLINSFIAMVHMNYQKYIAYNEFLKTFFVFVMKNISLTLTHICNEKKMDIRLFQQSETFL